MKNIHHSLFCSAFLLLVSSNGHASIIDLFKDEAGRTKWQHVANFSGSVLIVLLLITMASLLLSRFRLNQSNGALREIKKNLEVKVKLRTENLNKSNRLLKESNSLLEGEVLERKSTAKQLLASQLYLKSILTSMPSMLICLNDKLEVTQWNKTAETITGSTEEQVIGQYLWDVYPTITLSPDQVERVLKSGKLEVVKHSQRGQYYFDITMYPLGGDVSGVVVVIENVTQRSLAENMLIQRDKMASMGELSSTMAHDINLPLQRILGDVQGVHEQLSSLESVPSEMVALLKDAVKRGKQASAVVNNLLEFSGSQGADKHPADVCDIIDHCIELAEDVISVPEGLRFRDVVLKCEYQQGVAPLECYAAELQQVFLSIFRHACHALAAKNTEGFKPVIQIEVYEAFESLWVKVQHNGKGLTAEQQQDIFEPIVQHTTPLNPKPLALEDRLSFSYFIVTEHHQGEMALTSDADAGTTFNLQFYRRA